MLNVACSSFEDYRRAHCLVCGRLKQSHLEEPMCGPCFASGERADPESPILARLMALEYAIEDLAREVKANAGRKPVRG